MSPFVTARRGLSALALPLVFTLAMAVPALTAHADITPADSTASTSLNGSLNDYDELTQDQQQRVLIRYAELAAQIKADQTKATTMRAALDSGTNTDPAITEAAYTALLAKITAAKANQEVLSNWITSPTPAPDTVTQNPNYNNNYNNSSNSGGSSGGSNPLQQMGQQLGQQLMGGMMGGGGLGGALGGLTGGGMGAGSGGGTGGAGGGTGAGAGTGDNSIDPGAQQDKSPQSDCTPPNTHKPKKAPTVIPDGKTGSQTADNAGKAKDDIVAGPSASEEAAADKAKPDDAEHATGKEKPRPECTASDYTTPDPTFKGKYAAQMRAVYDKLSPEDKIKFMKMYDLVMQNKGKCLGVNCQCAVLGQYLDKNLGLTSNWREGLKVGPNTPLASVIATFNNGDKYGTDAHPEGWYGFSHTAIYMGTLDDGSLLVVDQFSGGSMKFRTLPCDGGNESCNRYSQPKSSSGSVVLLEKIPLLQPVWVALNLPPVGMGLLKS